MRKSTRIFLTLLGILIVAIAALGLYVKKALPNVGPPADLRVQVTPGRVQRGKYLANYVAGCMVCHSSRDTSLYAGPVKDGTLGKGGELFGRSDGFPGNIYASNLTPYHLGTWSDGELYRAITTGESRDGHALFPLMNYPAYGKLNQEDIFSIIAYLRALPSIPYEVPATELDFPVNFIVNTIPVRAAMVQLPDSNNAVGYGRYLVRMASCIVCHSKVDRGRIVAGTEFGGGREFIVGGKTIYSTNLTADKETGIGNWSREVFIRKFKQYADSGYVPKPVGKNEANTPMPWLAYAGMSVKDLAAMYAYFTSFKALRSDVKQHIH